MAGRRQTPIAGGLLRRDGTRGLGACGSGRGAGQTGIALVGVLLLTTLLLALAIFGSRSTQFELRIARNNLAAERALAIAETGMQHGFNLVKSDLGAGGFIDGFDDELAGGTGGALAGIGSVSAIGADNYRFRAFGGGSGDGYFVRAVDNFDERVGANDPAVDRDLRVKLISRGAYGGAERIVEAVLAGRPLFPRGLFGDVLVNFQGSASTDSYDSDAGAYPNGPANDGDVGCNGDVDLSNGGTVKGDASAGGTVTNPKGIVTGGVVNGAPVVPLPPVTPCGPPYSAGGGIAGGAYNATTGVLDTGSPANDISLAAGSYCFSSITLSSNRSLVVVPPVQIFLTGVADLSGGSVVNPGPPPGLTIYSSYAGGGTGVRVQGGAAARLSVYAPRANILVTGGGDLWGAMVGRTISMQGNGFFHYDEALARIPGPGPFIVNWREVRYD